MWPKLLGCQIKYIPTREGYDQFRDDSVSNRLSLSSAVSSLIFGLDPFSKPKIDLSYQGYGKQNEWFIESRRLENGETIEVKHGPEWFDPYATLLH